VYDITEFCVLRTVPFKYCVRSNHAPNTAYQEEGGHSSATNIQLQYTCTRLLKSGRGVTTFDLCTFIVKLQLQFCERIGPRKSPTMTKCRVQGWTCEHVVFQFLKCLIKLSVIASKVNAIFIFSVTQQNPMCTWQITFMRVTPPSPLAYCVPPFFGLAYCVLPFFSLAYCVPFNNKNYHFWRFRLHKDVKMTVCCMHMYNHSCKR